MLLGVFGLESYAMILELFLNLGLYKTYNILWWKMFYDFNFARLFIILFYYCFVRFVVGISQ